MASASTELPQRVGRYVLGPVIGTGGFAVVVRAHDESLDADVAIKILDRRYAFDGEVRERFIREARLLRRVRHASVVTVHDVGETDDLRPFMVMDLADGGSLQDRLGGSRIPAGAAELRAVVDTLADGLGALHAAGIVHRDIKPANLLVVGPATAPVPAGRLLASGEHLVIGDLGLAKDRLVSSLGPTMLGGTPGFHAPEQVDLGARIDERTDVYAATAVLWRLLTGAAPPPAEQLPVQLLGLPPEWRPVLAAGLATEPEGRFASMSAWADAVVERGLRAAAGPDDTVAAGPRSTTLASAFPFKGLAAFQPDDAALFFGRTELVDQLVARLPRHPVLVVGGASGSGKSSVVRAGLLPALSGGALPGSQRWQWSVVTPGRFPHVALRDQLRDRDVSRPLVLVVDQFEELFTLCADPGERFGFLAELERLTADPAAQVHVVLVVRADFYGACAEEPWLAESINQNQVLVSAMTRPQLRQAIEGPARRVGLGFETGLVDQMLDDAGADSGSLPLVAHALVETWLRRDGTVMTRAGYDAAGGVAGALGHTADEVWNRLDPAGQRAAKRLLLRLVRAGDTTPDTKRLLTWDEIGDDDATRAALARFADSRLVTCDESGAQLAHEALLRTWGRLAGWLGESRDELRAGLRIEDAAREWAAQDRQPDLLYRGVPLTAALEWRDRAGGPPAEPAAAFLTASAEARSSEEQAERSRRQRARLRRRRAVSALAALTAVAVVTSVVAVGALSRSRHDARTARAATQVAVEQLARGLAATAQGVRTENPYLATVLAAEAVSRVTPALPDARSALVDSREALAGDQLVPYGDPLPVGDALALAVNPAGTLAASGNRDGTVDVWNLTTRRRVVIDRGPGAAAQALAFTRDGRWIVGGSADGSVWRWPATAGAGTGTRLVPPGSIVWSVAASPDGHSVAVATQSGEVLLLDAASGTAEGAPIGPVDDSLMSAAFSPDGDTVLAGSGRGTVFGWSVTTRKPAFPPVRAHTSRLWEIVTGGSRFVTVASDGTAKVWDLGTGKRLQDGPFDGSETDVPVGVEGATLTPDGSTLSLGEPDGTVVSWSLDQDKLIARTAAVQGDQVTAAARSADGLRLVTLANDRTLQLWTEQGRPGPVTRIASVPGPPTGIAVSPDGNTLAVGGADGTIHLLDSRTGAARGMLSDGSGGVTALAFQRSGILVAGTADGVVQEWNITSGRPVAQRAAHHGSVVAVGVAPDGTVVSAGADGIVARSSGATLASIGTPTAALPAPVTDVAVAPDGSFAAATDDGQVFRWSAAGVPLGAPVRIVDDTVRAIALGGPKGTTLAAARADETLTVDTVAGATVTHDLNLSGHTDGALDVAFVGPDTMAVATEDGKIHLWDSTSGQPIGSPLPVSDAAIWHITASASGVVWAASKDGSVWRIDALSVPAACSLAGASFDAQQQSRLLSGKPLTACG